MIVVSAAFLLLGLISFYIGVMESISLLLLLVAVALLGIAYGILRPRSTSDSFEEYLRSISEKVEKWPRL